MQKIKLEFTLEELNIILKALKKLPHKIIFPLVKNIIDQYIAFEKERESKVKS